MGNVTLWERVWLILFFIMPGFCQLGLNCLSGFIWWLSLTVRPAHQPRQHARAPSPARSQDLYCFLLGWWFCKGCGMVWIQECSHCLAPELSFVSFCLFCSTPLQWLQPFSGVWWVCLFVWIQTDTASPPAYRHTDSEITSQWHTGREWRRREGGETDVQTELAVHGGWETRLHQSRADCCGAALLYPLIVKRWAWYPSCKSSVLVDAPKHPLKPSWGCWESMGCKLLTTFGD